MATLKPLQEPTFWILTALAGEPMHGYGIVSDVAALSGGRLALRPGTLYGTLDRPTDEGLVEPDRQEVVDGRLRRYYRLTGTGRSVLAAETERPRRNVAAATRRLQACPTGTFPPSAARHAAPPAVRRFGPCFARPGVRHESAQPHPGTGRGRIAAGAPLPAAASRLPASLPG
ncbi:PadR family transcriptional regulator [Micromonospora sp. HSS6-12]|uniref:PadR family transcriptional regulator n=1 Tax=Micromonospora thermarum TaxID=2720024 RepID=A0ABX0ZEI8_9ACTN|nr:PadR family transcriptional regulator [Micromonospora thermarum]